MLLIYIRNKNSNLKTANKRAEIFYDHSDQSYGSMISNEFGQMKDSGFRVDVGYI